MRSDRETYIGLDVVRFLAALAVATYHLAFLWWLRPGPFHASFPANPIRFGYVGVPVFFVLSGFIIAASALGRTAFDFLRGRVLRLYPAAWLCVLITLVVAFDQPDLARRVAHSVLLWPTPPWVEPVYWTLVVEIVFYLIVAAALAWEIPLSRVGWMLGGLGSSYWILRAADFASGHGWEWLFAYIEASWWGGLIITSSCFFGVGMALWTISQKGLTWLRAFGLALFVSAGVISTFAGARFEIADKGPGGAPIEGPAIWLAALALIICSIKYQSLIWRRMNRWGPATRTVGLATYPLYLVHNQLGRAIMVASGLSAYPALLLSIVLVVATSFLVVRLERYPRGLLRRSMSRPSASALPASDLP